MAEERLPSAARSFPSRIGRYRLLARVGRGAMGVVYSAVDEESGRTIALKLLMADLESDPQTLARFYREAQAAARLLHPNIITVYDAGEDHGRSYIAMQLLQGAALADYLRDAGSVTLERKLDLMIQVCEGLAAAHAEGIIHRDLKPNNLFVESDGLLKILDFGVARFVDSSMTAAGTMLGTPDYMPPEQAQGTQVDARSDIYSAGAVFYYMLSGHKPFPGHDLPTVLHQLQHNEPEPLTDVPPELAAIVSQAMAKDPKNRHARVEHLLGALVRFRRQYQIETRRLVFDARARFEEVEQLVASLDAAASVLGFVDGAPGAALQRLRDDYPSFSNRATTVDPGSFERATVTAVVHAVVVERDRLTALLDARRAALDMLKRGEEAVASGDAEAALEAFEQVLATCPASSRARELAVSQARVHELAARAIRQARSHFRRGHYEEAVEQLIAFVETEPTASGAAAELQRLQWLKQTINEDLGTARSRVRELLAAASVAAAAGRLEDALVAAREALAWDSTSVEASALLDDLLRRQIEARIAHERARAREQRFRECAPLVTAALEALQRGYPAIALQTAQAAQRIAPDHSEIASILERAAHELAAEDDRPFDLRALPWPDRGTPKAGPE